MMPATLDIRAAVEEGWADYCASFREVVARTLPIYVVAEAAAFLFDRSTAGPGANFAFLLFVIALQALATYFVTGMFLERSSRNGDGFRWEFLPSRFAALIAAFVLISAGMALGLILFILPGVLFVAATLFTVVYIIREGLSMPQALRASLALARPHLWRLAALSAIIIVITIGSGMVSGIMSGASRGSALLGGVLNIAISVLTLAVDAILVVAYYQIAGAQTRQEG